MNTGSGWIARVFGTTTELEHRVRTASAALAEKDRRLLELERQLDVVGNEAAEKTRKALELERQLGELREAERAGSRRAGEQEKHLMAALAHAADERAALAGALNEASSKLAEAEGELKKKVEREGSLGKAVATHSRRADLLATDVDAVRKQLAQAESNLQVALSERVRLEAAVVARDAELNEKMDLVSAAEWKIATLESELVQARSELQRVTVEHGTELASLRREQARTLNFLEQRQTLLLQTREALFDVLRLSAHALHRTLGAAAHLALELAAAGCPRKKPRLMQDGSEAVLELRNRLALIGVAEELTARAERGNYIGRFKLTMAVPEIESAGLARWVAAYAVEALNETTAEPLRLEVLEGGPVEFQFLATPRRPAPLAADRGALRDNEPPDVSSSEVGRAVEGWATETRTGSDSAN